MQDEDVDLPTCEQVPLTKRPKYLEFLRSTIRGMAGADETAVQWAGTD